MSATREGLWCAMSATHEGPAPAVWASLGPVMLTNCATMMFGLVKIPLSRRCSDGIKNGRSAHFRNVHCTSRTSKSRPDKFRQVNGAVTQFLLKPEMESLRALGVPGRRTRTFWRNFHDGPVVAPRHWISQRVADRGPTPLPTPSRQQGPKIRTTP